MNKQNLTNQTQSVSAKLMIVEGVIQNLPEIIGAIKEIHKLNTKKKIFNEEQQFRLEELNINKDNFKVLIEGLTDLSKSENADQETKTLYRDLVKALFETFVINRRSSQDASNYLNNF